MDYVLILGKQHVTDFYGGTQVTCAGRTFITTEKGYLGTVYGSVHEGDVVALLSGCDMPVL